MENSSVDETLQTVDKPVTSAKPQRLAKLHEVFFLGLLISTTGHQSVWNLMLIAGFWNTFFYCGFMGSGFLALMSCLGEMSSLFPFSGGGYAFARLTLGPFVGFLVGCCEAVEYIIFVAAVLIGAGQLITAATGLPYDYELIYWAAFFIFSITVQMLGGKYFWPSVAFFGVCLMLLEALFFTSVYEIDFPKYAIAVDPSNASQQTLSFQANQFMTLFPTAAWMFAGMESVALACNETEEAKINIPRAMVWSMVTAIIISLLNVIIASSQYPGVGDLSGALFTIVNAFNNVYGISLQYANLLAFPATFISGYALIYSYSKQLASMAQSRLFHPSLGIVAEETRVPYAAMIFLSVITYTLMVLIHFEFINYIDFLNLSFICSFVVYLCLLVTYLFFKLKYSSLERKYVNPAGIYGAFYGILVFSLGLIGGLFFQSTTAALIDFAVFIGVMSVYYYFYAKNRQFFSEEEQKILLIAYVINANARRHLTIRSTAGGKKTHTGLISMTNTGKRNSVVPSKTKYSNKDKTSDSITSSVAVRVSASKRDNNIDEVDIENTSHSLSTNNNVMSKSMGAYPATIVEAFDIESNQNQSNKFQSIKRITDTDVTVSYHHNSLPSNHPELYNDKSYDPNIELYSTLIDVEDEN
eukprot:gene15988-21696_t